MKLRDADKLRENRDARVIAFDEERPRPVNGQMQVLYRYLAQQRLARGQHVCT